MWICVRVCCVCKEQRTCSCAFEGVKLSGRLRDWTEEGDSSSEEELLCLLLLLVPLLFRWGEEEDAEEGGPRTGLSAEMRGSALVPLLAEAEEAAADVVGRTFRGGLSATEGPDERETEGDEEEAAGDTLFTFSACLCVVRRQFAQL